MLWRPRSLSIRAVKASISLVNIAPPLKPAEVFGQPAKRVAHASCRLLYSVAPDRTDTSLSRGEFVAHILDDRLECRDERIDEGSCFPVAPPAKEQCDLRVC